VLLLLTRTLLLLMIMMLTRSLLVLLLTLLRFLLLLLLMLSAAAAAAAAADAAAALLFLLCAGHGAAGGAAAHDGILHGAYPAVERNAMEIRVARRCSLGQLASLSALRACVRDPSAHTLASHTLCPHPRHTLASPTRPHPHLGHGRALQDPKV
jgi:hypothetical protein